MATKPIALSLLLSTAPTADGFLLRSSHQSCQRRDGQSTTKACDVLRAHRSGIDPYNNCTSSFSEGGDHQHDDAPAPTENTAGKTNQQFQRSVSRDNRIAVLEELLTPSPSQGAELNGLREKAAAFEEQYSPSDFSDAHHAFKRSHNDAFCALARYCNQRDPISLFFLDGPDAGTATAVTLAGFSMGQCHVANRHASSCEALRAWGLTNVAHASAADALGGVFGHVPFGALYLDGCGGHAPMIVDMMTAALAGRTLQAPIAVGFSLVGGNRDVVDKEASIVQRLVVLARGLDMRVHHVFDDPAVYGVDPNLRKVQGGTMTSWYVLEAADNKMPESRA
jgi:hypothetical protein